MPRPIDLPRIRSALSELDRIATEHPELRQCDVRLANNIDALETAIVGTPAKDRSAAYKNRLREKGYRQVSIFLSPEAQTRLKQLIADYPNRSVGDVVSSALTGEIAPPIRQF